MKLMNFQRQLQGHVSMTAIYSKSSMTRGLWRNLQQALMAGTECINTRDLIFSSVSKQAFKGKDHETRFHSCQLHPRSRYFCLVCSYLLKNIRSKLIFEMPTFTVARKARQINCFSITFLEQFLLAASAQLRASYFWMLF